MQQAETELATQENEWEIESESAEMAEEQEIEQAETEDEPEAEAEEGQTEAEGEAEEEVDIFLGDEPLESPTSEDDDADVDGKPAPQWVKDLRKQNRELSRKLKELESKKLETAEAEKPVTELPPMPDISDADIDYDGEKLKQKMAEWVDLKIKHDSHKASQEAEQKRQQEEHLKRFERYNERKKAVKVAGYDIAEQVVINEVPQNIQSMIIHYAEAPEMVVLAAGRNAEIRKQLANTKDPVELGRLIGSIEAKARIAPKVASKPSATPQVKASGGAEIASIERALEKARKSGNYDEVLRLKRKLNK